MGWAAPLCFGVEELEVELPGTTFVAATSGARQRSNRSDLE